MIKDRAVVVLLAGLGLCGGACLLGTAAPAIGAITLTATFANAVSSNIAADIFSRIADWANDNLRDKGAAAKNHDLRELVAMSIENVLRQTIERKPGGRRGVALLKKCMANVRQQLAAVALDDRFAGTWEQTVPTYFKVRLEDFATVKALTPELWTQFLRDPAEGALNEDEQVALETAASALHNDLPMHLVGAYRDALEHHPTVFVAVQTAILQELWSGVSRVDQSVDALRESSQAMLDEIRRVGDTVATANFAAMRGLAEEFTTASGELIILGSRIEFLSADMHRLITDMYRDVKDIRADVKELIKLQRISAEDHARQAAGIPQLGPDQESSAIKDAISPEEHFDRFDPLGQTRGIWPDVARPWLWLMAPDNARDHFTQHSRGQPKLTYGGDIYRGRDAALAKVRDWLTAEQPPGQVLVVTGQPGAGKSALVAHVALALETDRSATGLAFHARGATHAEFLAALATLVGLSERVTSRSQLFAAAQAAPAETHWAVVLDALDTALSGDDRRDIVETLRELAAMPQFRVVVSTRPLTSGNRYAPNELLPTLGVRESRSQNLIDLDSDQYFKIADLEECAAALLAQENATYPGPPGRAWTTYSKDDLLRNRLAQVIATRAKRNYLFARLAASQLSERDTAADPRAPDFSPSDIPSELGGALDGYFDSLPTSERAGARALLTALAYARSDGLTDQLWLSFVAALGRSDLGQAHLAALRETAPADYLLQTVTTSSGSVTRFFHQALADELLTQRVHRAGDEHAILQMLLRQAEVAGWANVPDYIVRYAADHAASAGTGDLRKLIDDIQYLLVADFSRLLPFLRPPDSFGEMGAVIRRARGRANALHDGERRARVLALTAAHMGLPTLRERFAEFCGKYGPAWAHSIGGGHLELCGDHAVNGVALGRVGERDVIVSAGDNATLQKWDATSGDPLGEPVGGPAVGVHLDRVRAVAMGRVNDRDIIVSGSYDGAIQRWNAETAEPIGQPMLGHEQWVMAVAVGCVNEQHIIVSGSYDGTVRIWDAATGEQRRPPLVGHDGVVMAVAVGRIGDRDVIVSGSYDRTVRVWDAASGEPIGKPLGGHEHWVMAVALGRVRNRDVIVSGSYDRTVRMWDAASGQQIGEPLRGDNRDAVMAVALGRVGDRDVIVSGGYDRAVRVWDVASGQVDQALRGHDGVIMGVALGRVGGIDVIVSGGYDRTVRVWDVASIRSVGEPLLGHSDRVRSVVLGRLNDRDVIVSGSSDQTVRVWDVASGKPVGEPFLGHTDRVRAVVFGRVKDRDVVVSGGDDGKVRVWDAANSRLLRELEFGDGGVVTTVALGHAADRDVIVSGGDDGSVRMWDADTGERLREPLLDHEESENTVGRGRITDRYVIVPGEHVRTVRLSDAGTGQPANRAILGHDHWANALAVGRLNGHEVIVSGGDDRSVRVWDAARGQPLSEPMLGHTKRVNTLALGRIDNQEVIVSGGDDGTVRAWLWDAAIGRPLGEPLLGHDGAVTAVMVGRIADRDVIVSGGDNGAVRVWDAVSGLILGQPLLGHDGAVVAVTLGRDGDRDVIISTGNDQTARTWDAASGEHLVTTALRQDDRAATPEQSRAIDDSVLASNSWDRTVRIWDAARGQSVNASLLGADHSVNAVALGRVAGNDVIVAGGNDGHIRVWDAGSGELRGKRQVSKDHLVTGVALGRVADRDVIVSACSDGTVRMWDAADHKAVGAPLFGHEGAVRTVAVGRSADGDVVVSSGDDGTVRVWDARDGRTLLAVCDLLGDATAITLSPTMSAPLLAVGSSTSVCAITAGWPQGSSSPTTVRTPPLA